MQKLVPAVILLLLVSCEQTAQPTAEKSKAIHNVSIMTFNVENLFDNDDDAGKDDGTYLPLAAKQTEEHKPHAD